MCFFDWLKIKMKYLTHLDFQRQNPLIFEKNKNENEQRKKTHQPANSSTFDNNSFIAQFSNIPNDSRTTT